MSEDKYSLFPNYLYEYHDKDVRYDERISIDSHHINKESLVFLTQHYVKTYKNNIFKLAIQTSINNTNFNINFFHKRGHNPFFDIFINYCETFEPILHFEISLHGTEDKCIMPENVIYTLFYHYNYILVNGKYDKYLNIIYLNDEIIQYNMKLIECKNEILFNISEDDNECSVCYDHTILKTPLCDHPLCYVCYLKLKTDNCPMCRHPFLNIE